MSKKIKHQDFGDMSHTDIEKWENEAPVIVLLDDSDKNDLAFIKTESFIDNVSAGDLLLVFKNNTKDKNMSVFSQKDIQRLKQFLNKHF